MSTKLESNLWKIAVSDILFEVCYIYPIYILYFQFLGFNFGAIGLFEAITSLAIILTDLPTGALADFIGRKWTVFIANIFMLLMVLILGFGSGGILIIILAGVFNGLEFSFKSGAKTALLYDTLKELNREEDFLKVSGKINAFSTIAKLIGLILGAYLFTINPRLPYWSWAVFIGFSLCFIMIVQEPVKANQKANLRNLVHDVSNSILFIFRHRILLWFTIFFLIADVFVESYWDVFSQAHLKSLGLDPASFGIIFAIFAGVNSIASYKIDVIEKKLGEKKSLYLIILVQGILFFLLALANIWITLILFLIILTTNREFSLLLEKNYVNKHIPSVNRASILSAMSFLRNGILGGAIIIWSFGFSIDFFGSEPTLITSGLVVLLIGLLLLQIRYSLVDSSRKENKFETIKE
ncbi:MAG: MFS transporter [Promethearchaeota archaeon]